MKSIFINKKQAELLKENKDALAIEKLTDEIDSKSFSLDLPIDKDILKDILCKSYDDSVNEFSDDITKVSKEEVHNKLNKLINICLKKQEHIKPQLEELCINTVISLFNIPQDCIDFSCSLENVSGDRTFLISPDAKIPYEYKDLRERETLSEEIKKRNMLNALTWGIAFNITESCRPLYLNKLFELDEELPHLYSKIEKINNYLLYVDNINITDKNTMQGGFSEVNLGGGLEQTTIFSCGNIFPVLLTESIKSFIDVCMSNGLPDNMDEAKYILNNTEVLINEPWLMRIGRNLWNKINEKTGEMTTKELPLFLEYFSSIDVEEFNPLMNEIYYNTKKGKEVLNKIKEKALYDSEYEAFNDNITQKQSEKSVIDEFITEEELENNFQWNNFQ